MSIKYSNITETVRDTETYESSMMHHLVELKCSGIMFLTFDIKSPKVIALQPLVSYQQRAVEDSNMNPQ